MSDNARRFAVTVATAMAAVAFQGAFAQAPKCTSSTCGVVQNVQYVEQKGQGSGVGLVAGGVVGGVLGHQIGSGRGNTAATIIGAGAGAYAGNEIEKNRNKKSYWTVSLAVRAVMTGSTLPVGANHAPPGTNAWLGKMIVSTFNAL